jgi:hypothetical protein
MYFCNRGHCPTANNPNSVCQSGKYTNIKVYLHSLLFNVHIYSLGKFGHVHLTDNARRSYQFRTPTGGINGMNEQCLVYYYHMSNVAEKSITVRKEEASGGSMTIDSVTDSPFNGWSRRNVTFNALAPGYKV